MEPYGTNQTRWDRDGLAAYEDGLRPIGALVAEFARLGMSPAVVHAVSGDILQERMAADAAERSAIAVWAARPR
jgi:hypothetical protein